MSSCPTDALIYGDLDNPEDPVAIIASKLKAKPLKEKSGTKPSVLYVGHEDWMEKESATGIQLSPEDDEIIYKFSEFCSISFDEIC